MMGTSFLQSGTRAVAAGAALVFAACANQAAIVDASEGQSTSAVSVSSDADGAIDWKALVFRHNVLLDAIDPEAPVMVGNGSLAMALDITGLQSFRDQYSSFSPLMTQAQWAWHSFPNPEGYRLEDTYRPIEAHGETYQYPYINDWAEADDNPAIAYMRRNPHRFSLGRLSFVTLDGNSAAPLDFTAVQNARQTLDLWRGEAVSTFDVNDEQVTVTTSAHRDRDMILVEITSPLVGSGALGVEIAFPYVSQSLQPDPAEWDADDSHQTELERVDADTALFRRSLDETTYVARASHDGSTLRESGAHRYTLQASDESDTLRLLLEYAPEQSALKLALDFDTADRGAADSWAAYWQEGGMVDFSGSTDPRAEELERRVVLSQYLTGVNTGGDFIPQEEGLYSNSWNGKFHHEMHGWHVAHFLLWNRDEQVAASLDWYNRTLAKAQARAEHYGRDGAWWPKMTGDDAVESPSTINPFIMWQQPHPIYLAELAWRNDQSADVLTQYQDVVFETADLLATFLVWDEDKGAYVLGPPVIPVQEAYDAATTVNPTFEVAYFAWGLETAQAWRERLGMERKPLWDEVLADLSSLPISDGLYLPVDDMPEFWTDAMRPQCAGGQGTVGGVEADGDAPADHSCLNRDHPSFLMATGLIPGGPRVDDDMMRRTMTVMDEHWDFRQTWGWDFPMMAMTAARLGEPEKALEYLMMDAANNQYGLTGMTPRYHLGDDGYVKNADTYFPSNGSLLTAVALMVAGWDGADAETPGFPDDGSWVINYEDITPLP